MTRAVGSRRRTIALATALGTLLAGCSWGGDDDSTGSEPATTEPTSDAEPIVTIGDGVTIGDAGGRLGIRLSEGAPSAPAEPVTVVDGDPIAPAELDAIFSRLPDWDLPPTDREDFNRPPQTLPPPLVGETIETPFPPAAGPATPGEPNPGPLRVLRYQPEGHVDIAPFLSVTFDQPMVPLATLEALDASEVPVRVSPAIEGRWRWIGTRTLRFELVPGEIDRLPAATTYQVEVPAGTRAANGAELAESVSWSFSTPAPTVTTFVGESDSLPLEPTFVAVFDQRVDPQAVLATIDVRAGDRDVALRLASAAEIEADDAVRQAVEQALDGRAVAFRPLAALPPDSGVTVAIGPGTPSAEGPLTSPTAATYTGRTYGALRVVRHTCDYGGECVPGASMAVELSNPLDLDAFRVDQVAVEPRVPGLRIDVMGNAIELRGATAGRTTYRVRLAADLRDVFGQTLGEDTTVAFEIGPAPPALDGFRREWVTTDPAADRPTVSITTINHPSVRVTAWAVTPPAVDEFRRFLERSAADEAAEAPDWPVVMDEVVEIADEPDRFVETAIDLSSAFDQSGSQLVVRIEPTERIARTDDDYWRNRPTVAWVQSTTLGVDAIFDGERLVVWTTDLRTGEPVGGVPVELIGDGRVATTDDDGVAELEIGDAGILGLWANAGDRTSFLPSDWYEGWRTEPVTDRGLFYVFDDRGIYRPGETARVTGWVRRLALTDDDQLQLFDGATGVGYTVTDAQGNRIAEGTADLNALGGFNLSVAIPDEANLGMASVELALQGVAGTPRTTHAFQVQEFRPPEFEVRARTESAGPYYAAAPATVAVEAEYYAGGPLPDAQVDWLVGTTQTNYAPPNWTDYSFGIWQPWWFEGRAIGGDAVSDIAGDIAGDCVDCGPATTEYERFSGRTDAGGTHYLQIDFDGHDVDLPSTVTAEATVFDVNRQAWASRADLLVHPAEVYVGLRSDRTFVERGTPIRLDAVVADVDGAIVPGRAVEVTAGRLDWVFANGQWTEELVDPQTCALTSTGDATDGSMRCEFATEVGGTYRVTAIVTDASGHRNRTEITQWVSGGEGRPDRRVEQQTVTIVPDRETYQPGDTAELLVQAPFAPAYGLVTISRQGIVATETFEAEDGSAVVSIPIDEAWVPNVTIQIDVTGSAPRVADDGTPLPDLPPRPAYATGVADLSIPPLSRALTVTATPADPDVEPGATTSVEVAVRGPNGDPVAGADVAVVVVDEAVLALTGYQLTDPLDVFYGDLASAVSARYARAGIELARADALADGRARVPLAPDEGAAGGATDDVADGEGADLADTGAIDVRSRFEALAVYAPSESTGADGTVTVEVPLPDNLTRYRVMAVAVDGADHFGKGESTITARLPLQVRPSAPRFLNFGDRIELPVVLQNQTDAPLDVAVAVQTANLSITGSRGRRVSVPAGDRVEVRFTATTREVGTARFRVVAVSGDLADAAAGAVPVYTPATAEAFATYGVIDDGAVSQPIAAPTGVFAQFGGLEINTSSTALQALTDAVIYLVDYPYESADGYASRLIAIAALRDVLDAFEAEGLPPRAELDAQMARDIDRLAALQNDDGGFPSWQRGRESIPWDTLRATHALVLAEQAGYSVPPSTLRRALDHLADIESHIPADYSPDVRDSLSAYALSVRAIAGERDVAKATALYQRAADTLQLDAVAWLWPSITDPALRADIARLFENRAVETAGAATFATDYGEDAYLVANSDRRTDGVVLDALLTEVPDSDLVPKVVTGLLGGQTRGRWNNAEENSFILVALRRYFDTFESVTPDFVARAWLGDLYAAQHEYRGRTAERAVSLVPMAEVIGAGDTTVVLAKDGAGRLYYRLGLRYAPDDLQLDARDEGFVVDRVYEAVDDPADVTRDADGTWRIAAGATVRVRLTMVADARRTHVALVDPLPAGLEAVNPALWVSPTILPEEAGADDSPMPRCWCWYWFEHQNLKDDRVEAFASLLGAGTYECTYVARATTPGEFVVPPARAEEIYAPEVFGRSASATVVIG